jgi:DNA-binding response OmpR family regulator/HPt (histidine-containing phosphotransfer) domain-containing protein
MKVLLIEDDSAIINLLKNVLTHHHWIVEQAMDGETGLALANAQVYDLVLLDIGLPKLDGINVCKQLRHSGYQNPILLLTGKDSVEAQIAGLDAGANDYITKPFNLEILLARVRALVRKGQQPAPIITWENIQIDPTNSEVICNGNPVSLTAKEYCLLELFLLNPKHIYSRRAILDRLWDFADTPGEETVSTHIKRIRQKLKAAGASDPIETVYGLGYRLRPALLPPQGGLSSPIESPTTELTQSPASANSQQKAQRVASRVWNQFKAQYLEQVEMLETLVNRLQPSAILDQQQIQHIAHKLAGSLGMFGLQSASQQAKQLEQLMQSSLLENTQIAEAIQRVDGLKQVIEQAQVVLPSKLQPLSVQPAYYSRSAQILIVDDDLLLADHLRIEAIAWDLQVEIATDLSIARQMVIQKPPSIILLDLNFPGEESGLTLIQELAESSLKIPIVIFTATEDLRDRVMASRLGVSAFLQKPLPVYEILKTLTDVLKQTSHPTTGNHILIVDDDPSFLMALSTLLSTHGMQVKTAANPQRCWHLLAGSNPDVLILDLAMPDFDGIELCQVVRADPHWQHLKVLFLSAHTETDVIARAYAAGADDYLSKAIPLSDLVVRILHRIGRN